MSADQGGPAEPKDLTILIIEDEPDILRFLSDVVSKEGFQVLTAGDGREALAAIDDRRPSLILTDLMLPKYGGFEVLRRLQKGDAAKLPVIVVTGRYTDPGTAELVRRESNVVDFISKPIDADQLVAVVHRVLKTKTSSEGA